MDGTFQPHPCMMRFSRRETWNSRTLEEQRRTIALISLYYFITSITPHPAWRWLRGSVHSVACNSLFVISDVDGSEIDKTVVHSELEP